MAAAISRLTNDMAMSSVAPVLSAKGSSTKRRACLAAALFKKPPSAHSLSCPSTNAGAVTLEQIPKNVLLKEGQLPEFGAAAQHEQKRLNAIQVRK